MVYVSYSTKQLVTFVTVDVCASYAIHKPAVHVGKTTFQWQQILSNRPIWFCWSSALLCVVPFKGCKHRKVSKDCFAHEQ